MPKLQDVAVINKPSKFNEILRRMWVVVQKPTQAEVAKALKTAKALEEKQEVPPNNSGKYNPNVRPIRID